MRRRLNAEIIAYRHDIDFMPDDVEIVEDAFETIKVQLKALGLMQRSTRKHTPSDHNVYWQITPYGEQYLTGLRAIKKGEDTKFEWHPDFATEAPNAEGAST